MFKPSHNYNLSETLDSAFYKMHDINNSIEIV